MKLKLLLCTTICTMTLSSTAFAADVIINGKNIPLTAPPTIVNGRTLVPMRAIFEELGAKVTWDPKTKIISGIAETKVIVMQIDKDFAVMQEVAKTETEPVKVSLDTPPTVINGNTYVPLRFVAESLDCDVAWDKTTQTVTVSSKTPIAAPTASAVESAVAELESIYKNTEHVAEKTIEKMNTKDAVTFSLFYDATKTQSEFQDLVVKSVDEVIRVAKKHNAPVFSIKVGIEDANGQQDLYWYSYNSSDDLESCKEGSLIYSSQNFEKFNVPYTEIASGIGESMQVTTVKNLGVTKEAYDAIKEGMTKADVKRIIGESGEERASSGDASVYRWSRHFSDGDSKYISITFSGAKVFSKSQMGL